MPAIKFEPMGIGDLVRDRRLIVPPNQRSYAWEEQNVRELLQDLNAAMNSGANGSQEYFLGTIVLVDAGWKTGSDFRRSATDRHDHNHPRKDSRHLRIFG
jgi:hypothetical protein